MRLFIALDPSRAVRDALILAEDRLRASGVRGRYTRPENLHLTLAFIGEYPKPGPVLDAMRSVPFAPFRLKLCGCGSFHGVLWAGIDPSPALDSCVLGLRNALSAAGIPFDGKRFSAHFTLVRDPLLSPGGGLPRIDVPPAAMTVDRLVLLRSDHDRQGVVYTPAGTAACARGPVFSRGRGGPTPSSPGPGRE